MISNDWAEVDPNREPEYDYNSPHSIARQVFALLGALVHHPESDREALFAGAIRISRELDAAMRFLFPAAKGEQITCDLVIDPVAVFGPMIRAGEPDEENLRIALARAHYFYSSALEICSEESPPDGPIYKQFFAQQGYMLVTIIQIFDEMINEEEEEKEES